MAEAIEQGVSVALETHFLTPDVGGKEDDRRSDEGREQVGRGGRGCGMSIKLFDTTLRDGTQREGVSLTAEDKAA